MDDILAKSIGYQNGIWKPASELAWSVNDVGSLCGAIVVERLRTFRGVPYCVELHAQRFQQSVTELKFELFRDVADFCNLLEELVQRNANFIEQCSDVSLVVTASPGICAQVGSDSGPTIMAYVEQLSWNRLHEFYSRGVKLVVSTVQNVSPESWSPLVKTRCRLQYFLADRQVAAVASDAVAALLNSKGNLTDTSLANLVVVTGGRMLAPSQRSVLASITQRQFESILPTENTIDFGDITIELLQHATEILLLGTSGQVHAAQSVDLSLLGGKTCLLSGVQGDRYLAAIDAMKHLIGIDFERQAREQFRKLA